MKRRIAWLLVVLLASMGGLRVVCASEAPARIWILPFRQLEPDSSLEYLQEALPALLAVAISSSGRNHSVVERRDVSRILGEQALTLEGLTSPETRHRIGRLLGATVMITGSFTRRGDELLMTLRALDLETGIINAAAESTGPARQLDDVVVRGYRRLAADLDRRLPDLSAVPIDDAPLSNLHFMKGLAHYHNARFSLALTEFAQAAEDHRTSGASRFWLAKTYLAQQQYAHAYLELFRLSGRQSGDVRERDVVASMQLCERHLDSEDVKMIRALAARRPPSR